MKNKETKSGKKKTDSQLINATFLDRKNNKTEVKEVIGKDDCWYLERAKSWILTHNAIKTIANIAGISKNYEVEESPNISPDYRNELEHVVRVTIRCNAKKDKESDSCVHSEEDKLTVTGESNRVNTPHKGRGYLRKMAEKRAFDIAVLEHLNLYSSVFSEEESSDFEQKREKEPDLMPGTKEFEDLTVEVNAILNSKNLNDLKRVNKKIKVGIKIKKYSDKQVKYLRELYQKQYGKQSTDF